MKTRLLVLGASAAAPLFASGALAAAAPACRASDQEMVSAVRAVHEQQRNVGVQVAIRLRGRLVFSHGLGLADRERGIPVTPRTLFPLASLTKAYTGVAALRAVAAGRLALDVPIQTYVPEFPVKPELVITPRRLAAHRAGVRHWGPERTALYDRHFDRLAQILPLFRDDPLLPNAGREYQYSSYGYNLLGLALERAVGVEFTRYVGRELLRPLRLRNTRFDDARRPRPGMTKLYSVFDLTTYEERGGEPVEVPARDYSHNMAGGNMSANAEDVARFGEALLAPGLLPRREHDMLFIQPSFEGGASAMSFGFFAPETGTERRIAISGANPGVQTGLRIYPDRRLVVTVLANTWGVGSRSGEMGSELPKRLADLCAPAEPG